MAPPSTPTPTPRRFLAPKRPATQGGTPKPLAGGTQQFQATPRFSLPSTPRDAAAAAASTPAPPPSAVFSRQRRESISDIVDSSPPLSPPPPPSRRFHDSIEVDSLPPSSLGPASSPPGGDDADPPSPKRRRLSASLPPARAASVVSSIRDSSLLSEHEDDDDDDDADVPVPDATEDPWDGPPAVGAPARAPPTQQQQQQQQPTFRPAPRFKPADVPEGARHEPLPDLFSPRRRGEKFVPGGLAAGLRDWLMDLESATGAKRDGEWAARLFVEQVRAGAGMRLVRARPVVENGGGGGQPPDEEGAAPPPPPDSLVPRTRLVLAGEGRLTGLARRNEVVVGSVLGIAKPVWEVGLGGEGRWLMACDWKVL